MSGSDADTDTATRRPDSAWPDWLNYADGALADGTWLATGDHARRLRGLVREAKRQAMVGLKDQILDSIERGRVAKLLTNDQARAASAALALEGHEAMLAARLLGSGSDPASLEYLATGAVSELVARAHVEGPGVYTDPCSEEAEHYLLLCGLSVDEARAPDTLRDRVRQIGDGTRLFLAPRAEFPNEEVVAEIVASERQRIRDLPFAAMKIDGVETPLYASDRGFASAYWRGERHAAVLTSHSYLEVGACAGRSLREAGITVDKELSPSYGLIFRPEVLVAAREALAAAGLPGGQ